VSCAWTAVGIQRTATRAAIRENVDRSVGMKKGGWITDEVETQ